MKKLISSILFAVLASSSLLLAQNNNRLELPLQRQKMEDRRWKMEVEATNQVTGCRLKDRLEEEKNQEAGSREATLLLEDKISQRTEPTTSYNDQVIGCRLQVAGTNQTTEDQIWQQADATTNDELRTANCDNALRCHLAMNPEEISEAENAFGFSEGNPLASRRTRFSSIEASASSSQQSSSSVAILGKRKRADEEDVLLGKEGEGISLGGAGSSAHSSADYQVKALEAEKAGKITLAAGYREAAAISEQAANRFEEAAEACAKAGANNLYSASSSSWNWAGKSLQAKAGYEAKASEAEEAGKVILAAGYREAGVTLEQAVNLFKEAVQAYVESNDESRCVGECWDSAGQSLQAKADYQAKASEAEEEEKAILAAGYREAATISEQASNWFKDKVQFYAKNGDKIYDIISFYSTGAFLQLKANYHAQASEKEEVGKTTLASGCREAVAIYQKAVDQFEKGDLAFAKEKQVEKDNWHSAAISTRFSADYQIEASEVEEAGKTQLAAAYRKAAAVSQGAAEYYQQAAIAYAEEKEDEGNSWNSVGRYLQAKVANQIKAVRKKEKEKTEESAAKNILEFRTNSNSTKNKALLICCEKWLAETKKADGSIKILSDYVKDVLKRGADHKLIRTFEEYYDTVVKAHDLGDDPLALAWIQVVEDIQQAIKDSINKAESIKAEELSGLWVDTDKRLSTAWNNTIQATQKIAQYRDQYIQASIISSRTSDIISCWKKLIEGSESVANYLRKAAEAYSLRNNEEYNHFLRNNEEYNRFNRAADSAKESVSKLEKSIEFFEKSNAVSIAGEPEISAFWRNIAEQWQKSAEYGLQVAKALSIGNTTCFRQGCLGGTYSFKKASTSLEKATQARESNLDQIAELWLKTAQQYHEFVEYERQAVNARLSRNSLDRSRFDQIIQSVEDSANQSKNASVQLEEATQGVEVNQKEVPELWLKTARKYEELAQHYRQAANVRVSENTIDKNYIYQAVQLANDSVHQLDIAKQENDDTSEYRVSNQREVTSLRLKIVKQYQELVKHHLQAINVLLNENGIDYDCFHQADVFAQNSARLLKKASSLLDEAKDARMEYQESVAVLLLKAAKQYQDSAEYERQLANVVLSRDVTYDEVFDQAGEHSQKNAHRLEKAAFALEDSLSVLNHPRVSGVWGKIAQKYQLAVDFDAKAAEEEAQGNKEEAARLREAANALEESAKAAEYEANGSQKREGPFSHLITSSNFY